MDTPPYRNFSLGRKSVVESYCCINNAVGDVTIGENTRIGIHCTVIGPVSIGNNVNLAQGIAVTALNHNFEDASRRIDEQGINTKPVVIGDDVWIGQDVLMTPGRNIAQGTIVGARCVLTKDFPPYSIVGGNPSRLIRRRDED